MKKKLFAILLSIIIFVIGLLPVTALAADPTVYGIWVDGVQITSENKDNLFNGIDSWVARPLAPCPGGTMPNFDKDCMSDYGIKTNIPVR